MRILIAGDVIPQNINEKLFQDADISELIGEDLKKKFSEADIRICNMEGPLTESNKGIVKSGPLLKGTPESVEGYKALFDVVSLANNHIMDYGDVGLSSTIGLLDAFGIGHFGAGFNAAEARKPFIIEKDALKIGLYSCAEHEFSIATDDSAGANVFDALFVLDDIAELKKKVDYLIVLYHGSKEYYRYPVPYVQKRCRRLVDKGADLVLCQHSHCIGCREKYGAGEILYGQGNFIFNKDDNEFRHSGLLVSVEKTSDCAEVSYIPIVMNGKGICEATGKEREDLLQAFDIRSEKAKDIEFVTNEYRVFSEKFIESYYNHCLGKLSKVAFFLRKLGFRNVYGRLFSLGKKTTLINDFRCEAHRDLFVTGMLRNMDQEN